VTDPSDDLAHLDAIELLDAFRAGTASPLDALDACIANVERLDSALNAVITPTFDLARARAANSMTRWHQRDPRPLEGVPYLMKDIVATEGVRTTGGSAVYGDWVPDFSATIVERLDAAGAVMVAKVSTKEFAFGHETNRTYGPTRNPWDLRRTTGGSSAGSGAGVAARYAPLAIGTDSGGSIRDPSSFCGLTGLKPTFGRVSRHGVMPLTWSLDVVGPMARSAYDAALMMDVIAGHDPLDPSSSHRPRPHYVDELGDGRLDGVRFGIPTSWFWDVVDPDLEAAADRARAQLEALGARFVPVDVSDISLADTIGLTILLAEFSAAHEITWDRLDQYDERNREVLPAGLFVAASDYLRAARIRHLVQRSMERTFDGIDLLWTPAQIAGAPLLDSMTTEIDGRTLSHPKDWLRTFVIFNVTGQPAATVPVGFDRHGMPLALQFVGRPHDDALTLRAAHAFQQVTDHHRVVPPIVTGHDRPAAPPVRDHSAAAARAGDPSPETIEMMRTMAVRMGVPIDEQGLIDAARFDAFLAPMQRALRSIPLSFTELIEPAKAYAWIEAGGTSP